VANTIVPSSDHAAPRDPAPPRPTSVVAGLPVTATFWIEEFVLKNPIH
jgi:hypothetical protein